MKRKSLVLLGMLLYTVSASAAVWYVDKDNTLGTEDGITWSTAFTTIQEGIDAAFDDGGGEVWVAEGVYDEARVSVMHDPPLDTGSLLMREGVDIYGGFMGTETALDERDWDVFVTVIDGSTARGGERAYHVVVGADDATLDGFTITGANAAVYPSEPGGRRFNGGGMYNPGSSPTVANCTFANNLAYYGGGMYNGEYSSPTVTDCLFTDNYGEWGGGMSNYRSSPTIINCTFEANCVARDYPWYSHTFGAGMFNSEGSPTVTNCTFAGNRAYAGGGMFNFGSTTVTNCTFTDNFAEGGGAVAGGGYIQSIENCIG